MRKSIVAACGVAAIALILPLTLSAPEAGAVSLPKTLSNGKICRAEFGFGALHWHAANGAHADKMQAQVKAIRDWTRFTAFEYGRRWGKWELALGHSMTCAHDSAANVWRCRAEAQPCKR